MSALDEADFPYKFASDSGDNQPHGATDLRVEIIVVYVERYLFGHEAHFVPPTTGIHLAAITPSSYQVCVIHEQVEPINFDTSADLIALTFFSGFAPEAYRLAREFKKRGKRVVAGGPHATFAPDEVLEYCDCVVIGEIIYDLLLYRAFVAVRPPEETR